MDLRIGAFSLKRHERQLVGPEGTVELSARSFDLLLALLARPNEVISKEALLEAVWPGLTVEENALHVHVSGLRKLLGPSVIATVHGRGYKYAGPIPAEIAAAVAAPAKPVIAILPFANLSDDASQKYFSDGIGTDIGTELSRFRQFVVRARGTEQDRARGATYVVDGSVRRMGQRLRISVQLIDAEPGQQLWSEHFDAPETEIFDLQDRIVHSIAAQLANRLRLAGLEKAERKPPASLAAYDLVLRGDALPIGEPAAEEEARKLFARAIELDPVYARAYGYLGEYTMLLWLRDLDAPETLVEQALELTRKAVALDGGDAFCHAMLGHVLMWKKAHGLAEFHYQKAAALNPNQPGMLGGLGILYGFMGEPERGLDYFHRALELDPHFDPSWYWRNRAVVHFIARQYQEAIAAFERSPISPDWVEAYLAACHAHLGRQDEAHRHAANALSLTHNLTIARFLAKEPYILPSDVDHLADGLRLAGFPA